MAKKENKEEKEVVKVSAPKKVKKGFLIVDKKNNNPSVNVCHGDLDNSQYKFYYLREDAEYMKVGDKEKVVEAELYY